MIDVEQVAYDVALLGVGMLLGLGLGILGTARWMRWRIKDLERRHSLHSRTCGQLPGRS